MTEHISAYNQLNDHIQKFISTSKQEKYLIHCQVVEACNILAADLTGYSDPYVKIKVSDAKEAKNKTFTASQTLNPIYNMEMSFTMYTAKEKNSTPKASLNYIPQIKDSGHILVEVLDHDKANRNDTLGFCGLRLETLKHTGYLSGWFNLYKDKNAISDNNTKNSSAKIRPGRLYLRFIVDHDLSKWAKLENGEFEDYRKSLFDVMRRAEIEAIQNQASPLGPVFQSNPNLVPLSLAHSFFAPQCVVSTNSVQNDINSIQLRLLCATWNTGNSDSIYPFELRTWLRPGNDIYAIATQENSYDPKKTNSKYKTHSEDWLSRLQEALGDEFICLETQSLGQIHIHVFVRKSIRPIVDIIQTQKATEATGIGNIGFNKGGACSSLLIHGRMYSFISAHLAAHNTQLDRRNKDVADIIKSIRLKGNYDLNILTWFHHTFFLGDLNYRLTLGGEGDVPDEGKFEEIQELIKQGNYSELLQHDQLIQQMKDNVIFHKFQECTPTFPPTFKLIPGQQGVYNPKRTPSYCDRILWRSQNPFSSETNLVSVKSLPTLTKSDHTPIMALFSATVPALPPAMDCTRGELRIIFHQAQIDFHQEAFQVPPDPVVRFYSPYLVDMNSCVFPKKLKTYTPLWEGVELNEFSFLANSQYRLLHETLKMKVIDRDVTSASVLGSGIIPFSALNMNDDGSITDLTIDLYDDTGAPIGVTRLKIQLAWKKLNASTALVPFSMYTSGKRKIGI